MYTEAAYALVILLLSPLLVVGLGGAALAIAWIVTRVTNAARRNPHSVVQPT